MFTGIDKHDDDICVLLCSLVALSLGRDTFVYTLTALRVLVGLPSTYIIVFVYVPSACLSAITHIVVRRHGEHIAVSMWTHHK